MFPLLLCSALPLFAAELPQLTKEPWLGMYAGMETRDYRFRIKRSGEAELILRKQKGDLMTDKYAIRFVPLIEDLTPDGKVVSKTVPDTGWEAVTPATADAKKLTFRGTVAGDASFEVNLEMEKGVISAGGKLLETGKLNNPRFVMRVMVPNLYVYDKDPGKLKEKVKKDRMDFLRTNGKKMKLELVEAVDAETPEVSGPGLTQARIEMAGLDGHRLDVATTTGGSFELWNREAKALIEGFTLGWKHDPAKDPDGKARLTVQVK
ncbi:hypothetical protein [Haloferula sp. BvORR071]|uniref:hypothetical protein n=1 Tax=Haloferula sp. BvORR071 TaxID=1396141 RepID=UPI002240F437|nr:hypothetical protein [Haloferula sp. BvORR071]